MSIFEAIMLICFGAAWPFSIYKSHTSRENTGKSVMFLLDIYNYWLFGREAIIKAAQETGKIVTVENHNIIGGLGSAVAEILSEKYPIKLKRIGIKDVFGKSGTNEAMKKKFGLRAVDIAPKIITFINDL